MPVNAFETRSFICLFLLLEKLSLAKAVRIQRCPDRAQTRHWEPLHSRLEENGSLRKTAPFRKAATHISLLSYFKRKMSLKTFTTHRYDGLRCLLKSKEVQAGTLIVFKKGRGGTPVPKKKKI